MVKLEIISGEFERTRSRILPKRWVGPVTRFTRFMEKNRSHKEEERLEFAVRVFQLMSGALKSPASIRAPSVGTD